MSAPYFHNIYYIISELFVQLFSVRYCPKTKSWAITTINTILKNEVYIGNMVQGKHKSI